MTDMSTGQLIDAAWRAGTAVPAFNIPYLPMMAPTVRALRDTNCIGLITVARLEWEKFGAGGLKAIRDEYERFKDERYTRLHLDHVPVVDEDGCRVDYRAIMAQALDLGYESLMLDGSRLPFDENVATAHEVVEMAADAGVPVEAELGAVLGHEPGPPVAYDEMFASGRGFTDPAEARQFVAQTGVDWLSVAIGNIHGAISLATKQEKKVEARLNIDHLQTLRDEAGVPLVLHGGSGVRRTDVLEAIGHGLAKINIGTATRQPYMARMDDSIEQAQEAVYETAVAVIREELELQDSRDAIAASRTD